MRDAHRKPWLTLQGRLLLLIAVLLLLVAIGNVALDRSGPMRSLYGLLFVPVGTAATYLFTRPVTRRLAVLTSNAERTARVELPQLLAAVTAGTIDPAQITLPRVDVSRDDEVGVLSVALDAHTRAVELLAQGLAGRIANSDARFRAGFERSPAAIAMVNADGVIVEANNAFAQLVGVIDPEFLIGQRWLGHVHPDDVERCTSALQSDRRIQPSTIRYVRIDGSTADVLQTWVPVTDRDGDRVVFLQGTDVSEARRAQQTLERMAFSDALTGLPNRAALDQRLREAAEDVAPDRLVGMVMLDLDRFKLINDSLGHHEGDRVLRSVGKRLRRALPDGAMIARMGGDEFAVVVVDLPDAGVLELLAEQLIAVLEAPIAVGGRRFHVSASIGVATAEVPTAVRSLSAQADAAAYAAKAGGRRRWMRFDATMAQRASDRLVLENDLRDGLGDGQLELHYQPIVQATSRRLTAMEALVRWRHPQRGLLDPEVFIGLAEDTGLISVLGWEVLDLALADLTRMGGIAQVDDTWRMSVNVSPAQLRHPEFVAEVGRRLHVHGVPAERLMLEITESLLMEEEILDRLRDLRRLGVWIALDDFGTGYTGVAYLSRVGVDVLKVDREIVQRATDDRGMAVLKAIGELGRALDMQVVAEGVETEGDAARAILGCCDRLQGFGVCRPVTLAEMATTVLPQLAGRA